MFANTKFICRSVLCASAFASLLLALGCGGKSSSAGGNQPPPAGSNVVAMSINAGPASKPQTNIGYVSLQVCVPGTSTCQTIPNVQVDTGSEGLRIVSGQLTLSLPQEIDGSGNEIAECAQFLDGFTWGPVQMADITLGGETASNVPVQVIGGGDANVATVPKACTSSGLTAEDTVDALGADGIIGIGTFRQDCGGGCTSSTQNPGFYFSCPSSGCTQTNVSLAQQLQNPVWLFPSDNNGTIVEMPAISSGGASTVSGSLVFGIGTQSNNGLGSATVLTLDNSGNFTTTFNGTPFSGSFIDSGSNGLFFLDSGTTGLPNCPSPDSGFYCPNSTTNLSATNSGLNGNSTMVNFSVANLSSLNGNFSAFNDLAGSNPNSFDWGMPFFFGRNVFTGIEGQPSPGGVVGPFFAY